MVHSKGPVEDNTIRKRLLQYGYEIGFGEEYSVRKRYTSLETKIISHIEMGPNFKTYLHKLTNS